MAIDSDCNNNTDVGADWVTLDEIIERFNGGSDRLDIGLNLLAAGIGPVQAFIRQVEAATLRSETGHRLLDEAEGALRSALDLIEEPRLRRFVEGYLGLTEALRAALPTPAAPAGAVSAIASTADRDAEDRLRLGALARAADEPAPGSTTTAAATSAQTTAIILDRHPLDGADYWRERAADTARLCDELAAAERVDLRARLAAELELGLLRSYLGTDPVAATGHLAMAASCGAALALARVCAPRGGFQVELRWPAADDGEDYIRLPATDNGFGWPDWLDAFALALLVDDNQTLAVLGTAGCVDACALPFERVDRFWPLLCGGLAALWQRDPAATGLLEDAAALLDQVAVMDPAQAAALIRPLVPLAKAIAAGKASAAGEAATSAFTEQRDWFAAQPDGSRDPDGLFALPVSALLAEAERGGLGPLPDSAYRLAPGRRPEPSASLVLLYPRLGILSAVEADWMMQNEGFARHDRSRVVQAADGRLVAHYRAFDAPGIPVAELDFELLDADRDALFDGSHASPALDVGELLHRAEVFASEPRPGPGGEPVYALTPAVEAMDLALAYLDAMPRGFDPVTLHSATGERLWQSEPGRFRRERMLVYRNALARQGGIAERRDAAEDGRAAPQSPATAPPTPGVEALSGAAADAGPASSTAEAREQVLELAEALTPMVLPLLRSLALDEDGREVQTLLPRDGDEDLAFTGEAVAAAREHYRDWWPRQLAEGPLVSIDPDWRVEAHLAPAGLLGSDNALSRPFPSGYRRIAPGLHPHRVWVCWHYRPPGASAGIAMNGLVWLDDHWAWFPKPYRLSDALPRH